MDKSDFSESLDKRALPDYNNLKLNIQMAQDGMLKAEKSMMLNYRFTGRFSRNDLIEFEGMILLLFGFLKYMIIEIGFKDKRDKEIFDLLIKAEYGASFKPKVLLHFKNFLLKYLHRLNLTNLLRSGDKSFDDVLNEF